MASSNPHYGVFHNNIPYARWGRGDKTMIVFSGGPGNLVSSGLGFKILAKVFDPFIEDYTLYLVTRKMGQPEGNTTRDMSNDYAEMINHEFDSHVNAIIGLSYGGIIAQHFAADHPELFDHIVIASAAHKMSDIGKEADYEFAKLLSQGRNRQAYASIVKLYEGKGHLDALEDDRFAKDVYAFIAEVGS